MFLNLTSHIGPIPWITNTKWSICVGSPGNRRLASNKYHNTTSTWMLNIKDLSLHFVALEQMTNLENYSFYNGWHSDFAYWDGEHFLCMLCKTECHIRAVFTQLHPKKIIGWRILLTLFYLVMWKNPIDVQKEQLMVMRKQRMCNLVWNSHRVCLLLYGIPTENDRFKQSVITHCIVLARVFSFCQHSCKTRWLSDLYNDRNTIPFQVKSHN